MGLVTTVRAGYSYLWGTMFKREERSLEDFYINRFGKVLYSLFFEGSTEKLWGRHPSAIAPDWGAQRVKGLSIRALMADVFRKTFGSKDNGYVETSLIESFRYPKFGPGQLWETTAAEVERMGGKLGRHACVDKLRVENGSAVGVEAGGQFYDGDIVISSMPLKDLVAGMDDVPQDIRAIA